MAVVRGMIDLISLPYPSKISFEHQNGSMDFLAMSAVVGILASIVIFVFLL